MGVGDRCFVRHLSPPEPAWAGAIRLVVIGVFYYRDNLFRLFFDTAFFSLLGGSFSQTLRNCLIIRIQYLPYRHIPHPDIERFIPGVPVPEPPDGDHLAGAAVFFADGMFGTEHPEPFEVVVHAGNGAGCFRRRC